VATDLRTDHDTIFVNGEWARAATTDRIEVISPWSEEVIATVPSASREDVDIAVSAAQQALTSGPWPSMSLEDRIGILERFRDLLLETSEELAQLITDEMGCPIAQSRSIQVVNPVGILEAYRDTAKAYPFRAIRRSANGQALVTREPIGVVAGVVPWNVPASLTAQKIVPALLTGCTIVLKPAPETPLDAYLIAGLLERAGLPPGVVNVVPADREVSEYLISHPGVSKVTFTGSSAAGRRIAEICGSDLRRVTLELGGKSAAILLEDADLDAAAAALRLGAFRNNGQVCTLKTRVLVPRARQQDLVERLDELVASMPVGDPHVDSTHIGPLVSERQRARVEGYIAKGIAEGARLVTGGGRPKDMDRGWFVEPTVFADVDPDSTIAQEEIFGPVVSVIPFKDENDAVLQGNDTSYGLAAGVWTRDVSKAHRVARAIRAGTVWVNCYNVIDPVAPFGGYTESGYGRELGKYALELYTNVKSVWLRV